MDNDLLNVVFSFFGGGIVVAIFDWIRISRAEKLSRRLAVISDQIQKLYGPLYFFVSQNQRCFDLNDSIIKAYRIEYAEEKYSKDSYTQENLRKDTKLTLDIANAYVRLATKNSDRIVEILRDNYAFIDPDDVDIFQQFVIDYNRLNVEREKDGTLITPFAIYEHMGDISFMRKDFSERVKVSFDTKKEELDSLVNK